MKTVLIVDDSRIMRNIVKSHFSELNMPCNIVEASNAFFALQILETQPVHLILLDWNMPGVSGMELLKEIRKREKYKTLPIIMVTSETGRSNVVEAVKNGASDYIIKPIDANNFRYKLIKIRF
jgi:two-component system chemotaxis response regulator CheY